MGFTARRVPVCLAVCVLVFTVAQSSSDSGSERTVSSFTCNQVRELFEGGIGSPVALHSQPELEAESSRCHRGKASGGEYSCCSTDTEDGLAGGVEKKLKEDVRHRNSALKKRLKNVVHHYQERLQQLGQEAENRTAGRLSRLHRIPWAQHRAVVAQLYQGLQNLITAPPGGPVAKAGVDGQVEEVVRDFFVQLFPAVFGYVLSGGEPGEERRALSPEYQACLKRYADQIQPYGNQVERVVKHLRRSLRHALAFLQALNTLVEAMALTETASMDGSCRHALLRLQVCPACRGVGVGVGKPAVRACRGLCLNVMRGCLAKMSEVSSSWDDLVVAFENLQVGMLGHYDLQRTLLYLDVNVTDAILMAMDDSVRIYREVEVKCQDARHTASAEGAAPLPLLPEGDAGAGRNSQDEAKAPRSTQALRDFRQEMRALVKVLEDSKGRFNRLPDWLCEDDQLFAQDMMSDSCWNGSTVGRYMEQVPEANFLSQVQRNKEVKLNLMDTDFGHFLQVKESLTHMRRDLSGLLNAEIMQGDSPQGMGGPSPYRSIEREGSGRLYHKDVIVDDEDLVAYGSGSGSGSGDDRPDGGQDTSGPIETPITRKPTVPPSSSGCTVTVSALLLSLGLALHPWLHCLH